MGHQRAQVLLGVRRRRHALLQAVRKAGARSAGAALAAQLRTAHNGAPAGRCDSRWSCATRSQCPQYQARQCNLSARFVFAVPEIKGLGLIELPTNSIYVLQKAYSAMQTVALARGRLTGTRFFISKREFEITRINEQGEAVRQAQMLTVLDADIDISALLDGAEDQSPALAAATHAAQLLEGSGDLASGTVHPLRSTTTDQTLEEVPGSEPQTGNTLLNAANADLREPGQYAPETIGEKRDRMADLLARLG